MKKQGILMLAGLLIFSLSISAQNTENPQRNGNENRRIGMQISAKERAEHMAKRLELTKEQTEKVQALYEKQDAKRAEQRAKFAEQRAKMMQNQMQNRDEMRAQRDKELKEQDAELENIIGKEKMVELNKWRAERMGNMRERMENRPGNEQLRNKDKMMNDSIKATFNKGKVKKTKGKRQMKSSSL